MRFDCLAANMRACFAHFNPYLALLVVAGLGGGCKSPEQRKHDRTYTNLRFHLESSLDGTDRQEIVEMSGVKIVVAKAPFLDSASVERASVVDGVGDTYSIEVKFDRHGTLVLDSVTTSYRGRQLAIYAEFGSERPPASRWLGGLLIARRISDGRFEFTPRATREETEEIVLGLNNIAAKLHKPAKEW
jgi:preprotein translocase subunit SecD